MASILLLDDDPDSLNLCRILLKPLNHEVFTSTTSMGAYEILSGHSIDLLVVDVVMPKVDGFEFIRALNKSKIFKGSILMLTGRRTTQDVSTALKLGAVDYICKPIDRDVFTAKVQSIVGDNEDSLPVMSFAGGAPGAEADITFPSRIVSISEMGLVIKTPLSLEPKTNFRFQSKVFSEIGIQAPPVRVSECLAKESDESGVKYRFEIKGSFIGLDEPALKRIRKWVTAQAIARRKAA